MAVQLLLSWLVGWLVGLVGLSFLWDINHCRLFDASYSLYIYIRYI